MNAGSALGSSASTTRATASGLSARGFEHPSTAAIPQPVQRPLIRRFLTAAHRDHQGGGQLIDPGRQVREIGKRRPVGPLGVVNLDQQPGRTLDLPRIGREVDRQPVQPADEGRRILRGLEGRVEQPGREAGLAGQQPGALLARLGAKGRGEQLGGDAEGDVALKVDPAGREYQHAQRIRHRAGLGQQTRFPDARGAFHHDEAARAFPRRGERLGKRGQLGLALVQLRPGLGHWSPGIRLVFPAVMRALRQPCPRFPPDGRCQAPFFLRFLRLGHTKTQ